MVGLNHQIIHPLEAMRNVCSVGYINQLLASNITVNLIAITLYIVFHRIRRYVKCRNADGVIRLYRAYSTVKTLHILVAVNRYPSFEQIIYCEGMVSVSVGYQHPCNTSRLKVQLGLDCFKRNTCIQQQLIFAIIDKIAVALTAGCQYLYLHSGGLKTWVFWEGCFTVQGHLVCWLCLRYFLRCRCRICYDSFLNGFHWLALNCIDVFSGIAV